MSIDLIAAIAFAVLGAYLVWGAVTETRTIPFRWAYKTTRKIWKGDTHGFLGAAGTFVVFVSLAALLFIIPN